MATAAVVGAIKVIGVGLSTRSVVRGIKNGNYLKAAIGAVGVYFGTTSLMAKGASSGVDKLTDGATNSIADKATENITTEVVKNTANETVKNETTNNIATNLVEMSSKGLPESLVNTGLGASKEFTSPGLWSVFKKGAGETSKFINENPGVTKAALEFGGGIMTGIGEDKMMKDKQKLYKEQLSRWGADVNVSQATAIRWNPQTARFENGVS